MKPTTSTLRIFCLLALAGGLTLSAQQTTATLTGTVNDASGGAVPGVIVKARNQETGIDRETVTNDQGAYTLPFLGAGEYTVEAVKTGFQSSKVSLLSLQVGQTVRVDLALQIGAVNESISVTATGAALQTESVAVGTVIDGAKIVDLPLNGRNFVQLAQLIPGVQAGTPGSITVRRGRGSIGQADSSGGSTGLSANGSRDTANRFFLDGVEVMDYDAMTYSFSPSVDSLSEFKVETSTYSAESGGAPGGQVNMLTKHGGNSLHGTLWEFNRNSALTTTHDAIANTDVANAPLNRNQFGANISGPVWFPKLYNGKNKTFFFFNWESGYNAAGAVPSFRLVPTAAQRQGDLSGLKDNKGVAILLKDPLGAGLLPNNQIPKSLLSPQAAGHLSFTPLPNTLNGAFNYLAPTFSALSRQKNFNGRVDHNFSGRNMVYGRFVYNDTFEAGLPVWGNDQRDNLGNTKNLSLGWTSTISNALVNDLHGGWHRFAETENFGTTNNKAFDVVGKMGLVGPSTNPKYYGPPTTSISGADGSFSLFNLQRDIGPRDRSNGIYQVVDTLSWQRGTHFLKIGADIARRNVTFFQARNPRGSFGFDGTYTGSALADFLLGYVRTAGLNPAETSTNLWNNWQSYFINDDWKVTQHLSITLGLRYDYFQPMKQVDDKFVNIEQNGFVPTGIVTPQTAKYGRGLLKPNRKNFGPRIGLAWQPAFLKDSVIRAGYGIYYTPEISNAIFAMAEGGQATAGAALIGNLTGSPDLLYSNVFANIPTSGPNPYNFAVSNDQNLRDSYIQQWNLNIQKKLFAGIVLDAGYVGSKGTALIATLGDINRPIAIVDPRTPGLAALNARRPDQLFQRAVTGDKSIGNSIYHSLQVKAERRMASGVTFLTAYTWAKSISGPTDIGGQVGGGSFIGSVQDMYNLGSERAVSGFDQTQRFVTTVLYDVPIFKGAKGIKGTLLSGWQVSTIVTVQSGFPAPISFGVDTTGTGIGSRPDMLSGQSGALPGGDRTWQHWFNTAAFAQAPFGRFGTAPRTGAVRLPGSENTDFSFNKHFRIAEHKQLEFRTEFYNLFNHYNPDPATVDLNVRSLTFGSVGGGVRGITTRVIQLGAKLAF
ncbi:MAG TPA: TonB-dependent receptor [Candidatus Solibacter sp.]